MRNSQGFTVIETLISAASIVVVIGTLLFFIRFAPDLGHPEKDPDLCKMYSFFAIKDIPAMCFKYFGLSAGDSSGIAK